MIGITNRWFQLRASYLSISISEEDFVEFYLWLLAVASNKMSRTIG